MNKLPHNATLPFSGNNNLYPNLDNYRTSRTSSTKGTGGITRAPQKENTYIDYNNQKVFLSKKKEFKRTRALNPTICIRPLGLKNEGLFCWLNSSIKLLLSMLDIEDILLLRVISSKNPHETINKIRSSFIYLWTIYNNFNGENRNIVEKRLNTVKNSLISRFTQFAKEGSIESDGLRDYFLLKNPNVRQDSNLFLIAMRTILCLDNPAHNLKCCTYIDAICKLKEGRKNITRQASESPTLIIKLPPDQRINSISNYIEFLGISDYNTYYWSKKELLEQGISVTSPKDIPMRGGRFENVEADLANLDSFIVYFSLLGIDKFSLMDAHNKITNIVLSDNFPNDFISIYDTNKIRKQYAFPVKIKAIICFSGYEEATHYICITIEDNRAIVHNDDCVYFLDCDNNLVAQTNYNLKRQVKSFFHQNKFTPYSVLYTSSV